MAAPEKDALVGGKYRLEAPLARGGMGLVWTASQVDLGRRVAVKFVHPDLAGDEKVLRRFRREARAAASLESAHVARIFDFGEEEGAPFIAMELLVGEDLAQELRAGPIEAERLVRIVEQLAKGLGEAHAAGILHRDLKPSNVFLARVAGEEVVKILDFGIAKQFGDAVDDATTMTGALVGSPRYMSPEQVRSQPLDARSDLWSVAVLLFEAFTGERLFAGTQLGAIIAAVTGDAIPRASSMHPSGDTRLDAFFGRALARDRELRFQTAAELAQAFALALGRPPSTVVAPPPEPKPQAHDEAAELARTAETVPQAEPSGAVANGVPARSRKGAVAIVAATALVTASIGVLASGAPPASPGSSSASRATSAPGTSTEAAPVSADAVALAPTTDVGDPLPAVAASSGASASNAPVALPARAPAARSRASAQAVATGAVRDDFFGVPVSKKK